MHHNGCVNGYVIKRLTYVLTLYLSNETLTYVLTLSNFGSIGATKKLGVAKNQVESFASMVRITRQISAADKASFLADATEIIGKIDKLIEHIETEHEC